MGTIDNGGLIVVSDAGPLIHLDELGCLDLLGSFRQVLVPWRVWDEVRRHRAGLSPERVPGMALVDAPAVVSPELATLQSAMGLGTGEIDALAVMQDRQADLMLCDDAAARLAGETLGLKVHGTIGVIVRSIRQGRRERAAVLDLLQSLRKQTTLFVSQSVLDQAIMAVKQG